MPVESRAGTRTPRVRLTGSAKRPSLLKRLTQAIPAFLIDTDSQSDFNRLMSGMMTNLPEGNSKTVRVFISSTFSDTHIERNVLMNQVYPRLKRFCREEYGLTFQIVDMRWGINEISTAADQTAAEICLDEVAHCQRQSVGPHFLGILSHRYGTRQLPFNVEKSDFIALERIMLARGDQPAVDLLHKWYRLDENQIQPVFVLQSLGNEASLRSDEQKLMELTESAARVALESGEISPESALTFTASVTHLEFVHGIVNCKPERRRDALLFYREITDLQERHKEVASARFVDANRANHLDEESLSKLDQLKKQELPQLLPAENSIQYRIMWQTLVDSDASYVNRVANDFEGQLKRLIERAVTQLSALESDSLYTEVLQHSRQCVNYVRQFQGREDAMASVRDYILGPSRRPLVIFGSSGCGKTSVLARAGTLVRSWLSTNDQSSALVVVRFLGTSPSTSSIRQTLRSICQQMAVFLNPSEADILQYVDEFRDLVDTFYMMAGSLGSQGRRVILFLDSIDQLDSSDGSYTMNWMRTHLPDNLKLVISTLPDLFNILATCRLMLDEDSNCFVEVRALEPTLCSDIVRALLASRGRRLNESQWSILRDAFQLCSLPIYMNLVFNQVLSWRSYTRALSGALEASVRGAIFQLFSRLERQFGKLLVSHSLAYITASRSGLSEGELEDLLSLDDDVLSEIFTHHLPPFIRVPPLCWARVRHSIGEYLAEREADGTRVLFWYHRQFWEVANDYLFSDAEQARATHSRLSEYFLGVWAGKPKPFRCPEKLAQKLTRMGTAPPAEADRQVATQPNVLQYQADKTRRFNLRKLSELPYHLIRSGRVADFHRHITFNFDFLESRLSSSSRYHLLRDLQLFLDIETSKKDSPDIAVDAERVFNAIRIAALSLNRSTLAFGVDLCGRLQQFAEKSERIRNLLVGCRRSAHCSRIVPMIGCFDSGSSFTHCSIQVQLSLGKLCENGLFYVTSVSDNTVTWYDLEGSLVKITKCERPVFIHLMYIPILPASGCFLSAEKEKAEEDENKYKLYLVNLHTGTWRLALKELPAELPSEMLADEECTVFSSEMHMVFRAKKNFGLPRGVKFVLFSLDPVQVTMLITWSKSMDLRMEWPILGPNNFLFYIGRIYKQEIFSQSEENPIVKPHILLFDGMMDVELKCDDVKFDLQRDVPDQLVAVHVLDNNVLLVTRSVKDGDDDEEDDGSEQVTFTVRVFTVKDNEVVLSFFKETVRPNSEKDPNYNVVLSADGGTAAMVFLTAVKSSMGLVCKIASGLIFSLEYNFILEKSHHLKDFEDAEIDMHVIRRSIFLNRSGDLLVTKGRSYFMFNLWSAKDGTFIRCILGNSSFYPIGQPSNTDFLLINYVPEGNQNTSYVTITVLNMAAMAVHTGDFEDQKITRKKKNKGNFFYQPEPSRFYTAFFDKNIRGGVLTELDLQTGSNSTVLELPLPDLKNFEPQALEDKEEEEDEDVEGEDDDEEDDVKGMSAIKMSDEQRRPDSRETNQGESRLSGVLQALNTATEDGEEYDSDEESSESASESERDEEENEMKHKERAAFIFKLEMEFKEKIYLQMMVPLTSNEFPHLDISLVRNWFLNIRIVDAMLFDLISAVNDESVEAAALSCTVKISANESDLEELNISLSTLELLGEEFLRDCNMLFTILNHPAVSAFPIGFFITSDEDQFIENRRTNEYKSAFSADKTRLFALMTTDRSREIYKTSRANFTNQVEGMSAVFCIDLQLKQVSNFLLLPSLTVDSDFRKKTSRAVAIEIMRIADEDRMYTEAHLATSSSNEEQLIGTAALHHLREFIKIKTIECQKRTDLDYTEEDSLSLELIDYIKQMGEKSADDETNELYKDFLKDNVLLLDFNMTKLLQTSPVAIYLRPRYPDHIVVQYLCDEVQNYESAFEKETMCWPGNLVVCNTRDWTILSVTKSFDAGVLYLLEDGLHCITYRLKVFNILTGDMVRDLDPTNSIILKDMFATPDRRIVIGKKYRPKRRVRMINRDENYRDEEEFDDPKNIVLAFRTSDGALLFDYIFEEEPFLMLAPANDRLVILLLNHPVQLYEILPDATVGAVSETGDRDTGRRGQKPARSYLEAGYLNYVRSVLGQAMARVADVRPNDPIEFMAYWLLEFAQSRDASS